MKDQELSQHLEHLDKQLTILIKSYQHYQSRQNQKNDKQIPPSRHLLFLLATLTIIITVTYIISLILNAKEYFFYIVITQSILSVVLYQFLVKRVLKEDKKQTAALRSPDEGNMSLYELDQQRFEVLQELAISSVPPHYMTPKAIKKMSQLVRNGFCMTLEECIAYLDKEGQKHRYEEEINLIHHLQTISYH